LSSSQDLFIYVHIPVCTARCSYCDFYSTVSPMPVESANRYLSLALEEFRLLLAAEPQLRERRVKTVYFGGGTPSLAIAESFDLFLSGLRDEMDFADNPEITLETQPATCNSNKLSRLRAVGINRFSVGAQSFDPRHLAFVGRRHTVEQTRSLLRDINGLGDARLSIDLISGWPGQTVGEWGESLDEALSFRPEHLSVYELTFYEEARLKDRANPLPENTLIDIYRFTQRHLSAMGYENYEISNYAQPGCRSIHNENYWLLGDYVGLGAGAHSFLAPHRWANPDDVASWEYAIERGLLVRRLNDSQDPHVGLLENLQMALRLSDGVDLNQFSKRFGLDIRQIRQMQWNDLLNMGVIELVGEEGSVVRLTDDGRVRLDSIIEYLI